MSHRILKKLEKTKNMAAILKASGVVKKISCRTQLNYHFFGKLVISILFCRSEVDLMKTLSGKLLLNLMAGEFPVL